MTIERYSEPYQATGGLAAEGVINQLGRPDIEPLEVLVREAVQNCWDARRETLPAIRVDIGRVELDETTAKLVCERVLPDPPANLPLTAELRPGAHILYFADFGTAGLGGPTRADQVDEHDVRDFVDFVRNIGQPPDKDFGGGSFGYGKAAFYIASRARTIVIDTVCETPGGPERRLIGAALGANYTEDGRTYTGRHWWGTMIDGVPEPLNGARAAEAAQLLGLPDRDGRDGLGTTVAIVAPGCEPDGDPDRVMPFIADALLWNFWPKMTSTPGGVQATIDFRLFDRGRRVALPDPRTHEQLRGFVDAMDRLRQGEPEPDDPTVIDHRVSSQRPIQDLGRVVIQKGATSPQPVDDRLAMVQGRRVTLGGLHHVALMRNAELVVKYLNGPEATSGRYGYCGVFRCSLDTDQAFRSAEPPTHDDWIPRAIPDRRDRTFVNVALSRVHTACRDAAGLAAGVTAASEGAEIPLGEFADALARLMPGFEGPGARQPSRRNGTRRRRRNAPGASATANTASEDPGWMESTHPGGPSDREGAGDPIAAPQRSDPQAPDRDAASPSTPGRPRPALRVRADPTPAIAGDGTPVMRYPFELSTRGSRVLLSATIQIMTNDGESVENDPPRGWTPPDVRGWTDPGGTEHTSPTAVADPDTADGCWSVEVAITEEAVIGVDIDAQPLP